MFDQAGMVREIVKWDYELRMPAQIADVVARAHEVAMTAPRGPVYLVLPREPLSASLAEMPAIAPRPCRRRAYPDPAAIEELAGWIADGRAAADHHGRARHRRERGRGARQGRRARRDPGGLAQCALGRAAVVASDECRLTIPARWSARPTSSS